MLPSFPPGRSSDLAGGPEWRRPAKLKPTYTDALADQSNPETRRVHTSYAMAIAATGRLSSTDPNLQNIPVRTEEGSRTRRAFIAEPGNVLLRSAGNTT